VFGSSHLASFGNIPRLGVHLESDSQHRFFGIPGSNGGTFRALKHCWFFRTDVRIYRRAEKEGMKTTL
ncbi:MAG TPA: hypothetical protein VNF29_04700, partial [Candidatus Binataceae bacterium]|nr:hypothetical protein [Candidatus Binataceae bacterium]